jgi:tRNA dimethylallyltransferase
MTPPLPPRRLLAIVGPTASGKSSLAEALADALAADILSVDSMQVYRHLDVGTAKPSAAVRARIPHHGLDLVDPADPFDAAAFVTAAQRAIASTDRPVIACGGTGFYFRALIDGLSDAPPRDDATRAALRAERDALGAATLHARLHDLDPTAAARIHPNDWIRIERALEVISLTQQPFSAFLPKTPRAPAFDTLYIGVTRPRADLYDSINRRLTHMWTHGLLDEAAQWVAPLAQETAPARALGYHHALLHQRGALSSADALALAQRDTRHFARRQLIWFCAMPQIHWLEPPPNLTNITPLIDAARAWLIDRQPWTPPPSLRWRADPRDDLNDTPRKPRP